MFWLPSLANTMLAPAPPRSVMLLPMSTANSTFCNSSTRPNGNSRVSITRTSIGLSLGKLARLAVPLIVMG